MSDQKAANMDRDRPKKLSIIRRVSDAVDQGLSSFFAAEGKLIARYPWTTILLCAAVTALCMIGFLKFEVEQDADTLYTPNDAESVEDRAFVRSRYGGLQEQSFNIYGIDKTSKGNVLTKEHLLDHLKSVQGIFDAKVFYAGATYNWTGYCAQAPPPANKECKVDSILRFWNFNATTLQADPDIMATINKADVPNFDGRPMRLSFLLGGVTRSAGVVTKAEAFQTILRIRANQVRDEGRTVDYIYNEWNNVVLDKAYENFGSAVLKQYVASNGATARESSQAIQDDIILLTIGYFLIIIFIFICLWRNSKPYQKTHVTLAGLVAIGCGIATDFGLLSALGVKFNFVCQVLPFLLVGIGADNIFVLISGYFQQDPDAPVEERISKVMRESGAAITVTSMTNIIAFAVGAYTNLDALFAFSLYAAIGLLFIYIYTVTLFTAFLALDARREMRARARGGNVHAFSLLCCSCVVDADQQIYDNGMNGWQEGDTHHIERMASMSMASKTSFSAVTSSKTHLAASHTFDSTPQVAQGMPQPGIGRNKSSGDGAVAAVSIDRPPSPPNHMQVQMQNPVQMDIPMQGQMAAPAMPYGTKPTAPSALGTKDWSTPGYFGTGPFDPLADTLSTKLIARWLPKVTLHPYGKVMVILMQILYLAAAVYGCTQVYMDFNFRRMFVPKGNWLHGAYDVQEKYFQGDSNPVAVYTKAAPAGKTYFDFQDELARIAPAMRNNSFISAMPRFNSWYEDYLDWLKRSLAYSAELVEGRPPNSTVFKDWLDKFINSTAGSQYKRDILFDTSGVVVGARMSGLTTAYVDGEWATKLLDSVRATAAAAAPSLQTFAYSEGFVFWEGFKTIQFSTVVNVIIAGAAVFLLMLLLLGHFMASIGVGMMVVMCDVGVLGVMHYADLQFNVVTCIVIVMAVGIAVDYSAHVMRAYLISNGTYHERAIKALEHIGGAVWNGILSTFLVILPMAFASHYIFTSIFKMFVFLVWVSAWHGLVLLPVLLSLWGPASYSGHSERLTPGQKGATMA